MGGRGVGGGGGGGGGGRKRDDDEVCWKKPQMMKEMIWKPVGEDNKPCRRHFQGPGQQGIYSSFKANFVH